MDHLEIIRSEAPLLHSFVTTLAPLIDIIDEVEGTADVQEATAIQMQVAPHTWAVLEEELCEAPRRAWGKFTPGIEIHADGALKKLRLFDGAAVVFVRYKAKDNVDVRKLQ